MPSPDDPGASDKGGSSLPAIFGFGPGISSQIILTRAGTVLIAGMPSPDDAGQASGDGLSLGLTGKPGGDPTPDGGDSGGGTESTHRIVLPDYGKVDPADFAKLATQAIVAALARSSGRS